MQFSAPFNPLSTSTEKSMIEERNLHSVYIKLSPGGSIKKVALDLLRTYVCNLANKNPRIVVGFPFFLANDVTLVTSYGYCQSLKINDIRQDARQGKDIRETPVLRFVRLGGYSVRRWVGVCPGTLKVLPTHTANVIGVRPPGFEVFCIYFECLFCVREVWQDFIRIVVLCLLS